MKEEIALKWIENLRNGKYKQTVGVLHNTSGYCCLGVLCDIAGDGKWKRHFGYAGANTKLFSYFPRNDEQEDTIIPESYLGRFGMTDQGGELNFMQPDEVQITYIVPPEEEIDFQLYKERASEWNTVYLTSLNDSGYTFDEIADIIEEYWPIL